MGSNAPEVLGLSSGQAKERLLRYGYNTVEGRKRLSDLEILLNQFKNPYYLLLLFTAILSAFLGEKTDAVVIVSIILLGSLLDFWQERGAYRTVEKLLTVVKTRATVIRDGEEKDVPLEEVVPEDAVVLRAGDMVPADGVVLQAKDLFVNEALMTGEAYPVEKTTGSTLYMGTHVVSGFGIMKVLKTGRNTEYGKVVEKLRLGKGETDFERGLRRFGYTLLEVATLLILLVFAINAYYNRGVINSLLFALSLGIGITPALLPAVVSIGLSYGARYMARKNAIVKRLASIENFGSMTVLCCDKTGTLTEGSMEVYTVKNILDEDDERIALLSYVNSCFQTGYKNPVDEAIKKSFGTLDISQFQKLDELPYDFNRKRLSVLVKKGEESLLITKGAYSHVLEVCKYAQVKEKVIEIKEVLGKIEEVYARYSGQGFKLIAVAYRLFGGESLNYEDEKDEVFLGFLILHDPLRKDAKELVEKLLSLGIELRIITGDNKLVAKYVAERIGLKGEIMSGGDFEKLSEEALVRRVRDTSVFAELTPLQKDRVVTALRKAGYVVGYMGDGINDVAAMRSADVAISVENAVDVAKETADIVLLKSDLNTVIDAVLEGRRIFINTMKYLFMQTSSNFGNVFSMAGASLLIPFLPMLPKQVLTANLLTDSAVMSIPTDRVDDDWTKSPKRWNIEFIRRFMLFFGPLSSIFDYITFIFLLYVLRVNQETFRSAWFLEGLFTQILVLLLLRTQRIFIKSRPSPLLMLTVLTVGIVGLILPFTPLGSMLELRPLPTPLYAFVLWITLLYFISVEAVKKFFYRKYNF
ncbi:magnesium-translocating P-type ATPase [Hydrogenobacter thermophilus TK-6]|uniref:Magnesium-transporting ATPase, P-type 1 n=1 Tax=Hydrogenobacter thermophilus (strain DSM 6534 / IAM 12695 / TK-6) TaxID=608538 RepID=D3DHG2_HYDTT|nr:magnesium-translocating P-type ATPase [Hydrogenobacter thermophilus]ADO45201.1 magnesium-translocating P-type ATPase [Hydrogenobacter thermophilus TK-6]BAI69264.1 magnesium-translocating P-type ATPase [Hydrogenobacter thermophilus TK-6]